MQHSSAAAQHVSAASSRQPSCSSSQRMGHGWRATAVATTRGGCRKGGVALPVNGGSCPGEDAAVLAWRAGAGVLQESSRRWHHVLRPQHSRQLLHPCLQQQVALNASTAAGSSSADSTLSKHPASSTANLLASHAAQHHRHAAQLPSHSVLQPLSLTCKPTQGLHQQQYWQASASHAASASLHSMLKPYGGGLAAAAQQLLPKHILGTAAAAAQGLSRGSSSSSLGCSGSFDALKNTPPSFVPRLKHIQLAELLAVLH